MTSDLIDATAAAELFLAGARDAGLRHVCISPGSRSTPLAIAALRTAGISTSVHLDERVASFCALGIAAATGAPTGLICTSGTAGANYLPAISEANMNNTPLIAITADRPPEHQSWGVGQTFSQKDLYHDQVRAKFEMAVGGSGGREFSSRAGWRAACTALEQHGPVHVNWPFRLPLEPQLETQPEGATFGAPNLERPVRDADVKQLSLLLASASSPVLVAGPNALRLAGSSPIGERAQLRATRLHEAARSAGLPILADALSGLRGNDDSAAVPAGALIFNRPAAVVDTLTPDLIIHMGQTPTAKSTRLWWEETSAIHVLLDPDGDWNDPSHLASHRFTSDPVELLVAATSSATPTDGWLDHWQRVGRETAAIRDAALANHESVTDAHVAALVSESLQEGSVVFTSSSMPVRDVDTFGCSEIPLSVHANRGINGIDGVVSTASGFAQATNSLVTVLIGDVALLHDVGGVLDAARNQQRLVIVVSNNDGGGIFSLLPAKSALDPDHFDQVFNTAHGTTFDFLGQYPNVTHHHVTDVQTALQQAHSDPQAAVTILEVAVSTEDRLAFQANLHERLASQ